MDELREPNEPDRQAIDSSPWQIRHTLAMPELSPLRLVLQPGGRTLELRQPDVIVGRHSEADVRLPLPDVSRRHCRLLYADGSWRVFDLHSLNGIYLNGQPVEQAFLHQGDQLRVGGFVLQVDLGLAEQRRAG